MMIDTSRRELVKHPITAAEMAIFLKRLARLFDSGGLGNAETSTALISLAEHLQSLGSSPIEDLGSIRRPRKKAASFDSEAVRKSSINDVRKMLEAGLSKSSLVQLARLRFGMPESRLRRLPTEEVIEAIQAAAAHEESLDIIERNAELSGRARSS